MKKIFVYFFIVFIIFMTVYINKVVQLEYDVNLVKYIEYSKGLTKEEINLLKDNKSLVYGGNINEPPLGVYYEGNGQYMGLVVDYINAISIELGIPIISRPMIWNESLDSLAKGSTHLCDMVPSKERGKKFEFSNPIYNLRGLVVVNKTNKNIHKIEDINGKIIGVQKGDYSIERLKELNINAKFVFTNNVSQALNLLDDNKVDVVMGDEPVIWYHMKELSHVDKYRILQEPLYDKECVIAVNKDKKYLIEIINKSIFSLKKKGILDKIYQKWNGFSSSFYKDKESEKLKIGISIFIILFSLLGYTIYLWNKSLKVLVKARTQELEITKNELQVTFDSIKSYLVVIDSDGTIKNMNSALKKYLNTNVEAIINKNFRYINILANFNEKYKDILNQDICLESYILEKKEYKYEGRFYEVSIYPFKSEDTSTNQKLIMIEDVTMDKIKEQKIVHSNRMESVGKLASGIAHELRNPLGIIRNSTYILEDEEDELIKKKVLKAIDSSVNRASKIIDNLLKFSRLTNDVEEIINIKDLILEITQYFKRKFSENNIKLIFNCEDNITITSNPESIKHIFINLISNSIDAMKNGGNIEIDCKYLSQKNIEIIIKDNGMGMSEEIQERIFDPFFTTKPIGKGTGLGLYIVYSELLKINGEIKVNSKIGEGTTFVITI